MSYYLRTGLRYEGAAVVRALPRFLTFCATFISMALVAVVTRALLPGSIHRRHAPSIRRWIGRRVTGALAVRVRRSGSRVRLASLTVCNHLSWLDSFLLGGEIGARFIAESSWAHIPVLSTALRAGGVIFIDRRRLSDARRVGAQVRRMLERGESVVVFAEANTSRGETVLPFRGALLQPAATNSFPVSWAVLRYENPPGWPPASVTVAWTDWTPIALHIYRACYPPYIDAEIEYGTDTVVAPTRKELARELESRVRGRFRPMPQVDPADLIRIDRRPTVAQTRF
jgi:1-acyl-sn-glycerol-3-phosphate acyltransferase